MKSLRDLTAELQTLCHEGYSDCPVLVSVLEAHYKAGGIHKMTVGNGDVADRTYFVIDTEVLNEVQSIEPRPDS